MATDWSQYVTNVLSLPYQRPGSVDFSSVGALADGIRSGYARKDAKEQNDIANAAAAAKTKQGQENWSAEHELNKKKFELEQSKQRNKESAELGDTLRKGAPELISGDPGRAGAVMSEWKTRGGSVEEKVAGEPEKKTGGDFYSVPEVPGLPDSFTGDLGPGRALERSETLPKSDDTWWDADDVTPYAKGKEGLGDVGKKNAGGLLTGSAEADDKYGAIEGIPSLSLDPDFMPTPEDDLAIEMTDPWDNIDNPKDVPHDVTVTASTERKVYEFKDAEGNLVATLDPERLKHNAREVIYTAVDTISAPFVGQFPRETEMARGMVDEWYIAYMTSPGSTTAGALEYVTDNFTKMIRNQIQADAQRKELGLPQLDLKKVAEGMKQVAREWPKGQEVVDGLAAANQGHDMVVGFDGPNGHVNGLLEDVKAGIPINTNKLIDLRFQIAKTRAPGDRITDMDFNLTAGLRSVSQSLGDWWERTFNLTPEEAIADGIRVGVFDNDGNMDATISRDLAEQFERYFYEAGEARELQLQEHKPMLQAGYDMLIANNDFAGANGYARRANTMLDEDFLPTVSANEAHQRMGLAPPTTYADTQQPRTKAQDTASAFRDENPTPEKSEQQLAEEKVRAEFGLGKGSE